jgi:putative chitinase
MITTQILKAAFPQCKAPDKWPAALNTAMEKYSINTPSRVACFLAQIGHESGCLNTLEESLFYKSAARIRYVWPSRFPTEADAEPYVRNAEALANKVYAGRMGNSNPGDGYKYRGRGLIQLTGKANYEAQGITDPDVLLTPNGAALSAAKYWFDRHCNELADSEDILSLTKKINGGTVGLSERVSLLKAVKRAMA